jgi:hypothetical protein
VKKMGLKKWIDLTLPIENYNLSNRLLKCLQYMGIKTLNDILKCTPGEMLKTRDFGHKTLNELEKILFEKGFTLKGSDYPNKLLKRKRRSSLEIQIDREKRLLEKLKQERTVLFKMRQIKCRECKKIFDIVKYQSVNYRDFKALLCGNEIKVYCGYCKCEHIIKLEGKLIVST